MPIGQSKNAINFRSMSKFRITYYALISPPAFASKTHYFPCQNSRNVPISVHSSSFFMISINSIQNLILAFQNDNYFLLKSSKTTLKMDKLACFPSNTIKILFETKLFLPFRKTNICSYPNSVWFS